MVRLGCMCTFSNGFRSLSFFIHHLPLSYSTSTTLLCDFLVKSVGFSKQQSLSTSAKLAKLREAGKAKRVNEFTFAQNANSVIHFFHQFGFLQSQIRKIICSEPRILVSKVDKTLKPKFQTLIDLGICGPDLVDTISKNPLLLRFHLLPVIQSLRIVLGHDHNVVRIFKKTNRVSFSALANNLIPNVELLRIYCGNDNHASSGEKLQKYIVLQPGPFIVSTDMFRDMLIRVDQQLRIPRHSSMFLYGLQLVAACSDKNIEAKCQMFKSFGWTQLDIESLIRRNPLCLTSTEARIKDRLDFLMNQLGYKPDYLAYQPAFFTYSVVKRLMPRHRVLEVLKEKGIVNMNYCFSTVVVLTEPKFFQKFVKPYKEVQQVYAQYTGSTVGCLSVGSAKGES